MQKLCGAACDNGPPRLPQQPISASQEAALDAALTKLGFWNQTAPGWTPPLDAGHQYHVVDAHMFSNA